MKKITIIGNATKAPEQFATTSGNEMVRISVAVNSYEKGEKKTEYFTVPLFGKTAANALQYLDKGSKVAVNGDLVIRSYVSKAGDKKLSLEISNASVEYLSSKSEKTESAEGWNELSTEDIPF